MPLDWAADLFKTLIGTAAVFSANWIRKKFKPTMKHLKRISEVSDRVDGLETKVMMIEGRQHALMYIDPRPIFVLNSKNEVKSVNPAWLEMTGMQTEKDALGFGYLRAIPEEDRDMMMEQAETFLEHPGAFSGEVKFKNVKTGTIIITYCRSEIVLNKELVVETIGILKQI